MYTSTMKQSNYHPVPPIRRSVVRDILAFHNRPDMIPFAGGLPDPTTLPVAEMARAAQYVLSRQGAAALQYGKSEGFEPLRSYIAEYLTGRGFPSNPDQILITSGSQQGMDLISRWLLRPGDSVFTTEPLYNGALQNFDAHQANIHPILSDDEGPCEAALLAALHPTRPAIGGGFFSLSRRVSNDGGPGLLYLQPTLANPTGSVISNHRRQIIGKALHRFQGWMLEEDPYGELLFDSERPNFISSYHPARSVLLGSFSKIVSPSLRIGWVRAPESAIQSLLPLKQSMDLHTNLFSQMMLHRFLEDVDLTRHLDSVRTIYARKQQITLEALRRYNLQGRFQGEFLAPGGGMFLWLRTEVDSDALARVALDRGVAVVPGSAFFSNPEDGKSFIRLNYTAVDTQSIELGVQRLAQAYRDLSQKKNQQTKKGQLSVASV